MHTDTQTYMCNLTLYVYCPPCAHTSAQTHTFTAWTLIANRHTHLHVQFVLGVHRLMSCPPCAHTCTAIHRHSLLELYLHTNAHTYMCTLILCVLPCANTCTQTHKQSPREPYLCSDAHTYMCSSYSVYVACCPAHPVHTSKYKCRHPHSGVQKNSAAQPATGPCLCM